MKYKNIFLFVFVVMMLAFVTGCETPPEETEAFWENRINRLETTAQQAETQIITLRDSLDQMSQDLATADPDSEFSQSIREKIDEGSEALSNLLSKKQDLDSAIKDAKETLNSIPEGATSAEINAKMIGQTVSSAAPFLPPQIGAIVTGVGMLIGGSGGIFGLIGRKRAKRAEQNEAEANDILVGTITAIEEGKVANENLRKSFGEAADTINSRMPSKAKKRVREIRNEMSNAA